MKKIKIWKVILLSFITFGIYDIVWYIKRQEEMEKTYELTMPHWLWMLLSPIAAVMVAVPAFIFVGLSNFSPLSVVLAVFAALLIIASFAITIWWFVGFSRAAAKVIANRVPTGWSVALFLIAGNVVQIVAHQYYFNRYASDTLPAKSVGPSERFRNIAILIIAISIAGSIMGNTIPSPAPPSTPEQTQSNG